MDLSRREVLAAAAVGAVALKPENPVVGGTFLRRAAIRSPNYVLGSTGWTINQDGSAEFNNVTVRGTVIAGHFIGNGEGLEFLIYSGPQALGNLIHSIVSAAATDSQGNTVLAGDTSYLNLGVGGMLAMNFTPSSNLGPTWQTAPGPGGAYTVVQSIQCDVNGNLTFTNAGTGVMTVTPHSTFINQLHTSNGNNAWPVMLVDTAFSPPANQQVQRIAANAAADAALGIQIVSDTVPRLLIDSNGKHTWGPGAAAASDTDLFRNGVSTLRTTSFFDINTTQVPALRVTETTAAPASPPVQAIAAGAGDRVLGIEATGDTSFRMRVDSNGRHDWGPGNAATDVALLRSAVGVLAATGNLVVGAAAETTTAALEVQAGVVGLQTHAAPATPPAGFAFLYINSTDLLAHLKSAAGADATLSVGSGDNTPVTVTAAVATRISKNWNIAANEVNSAGQTYRLTAWGNGTQGSTAQSIAWSVWLDGAAVQFVNATALPINAPFRWKVEILLSVATVGAGGNGSVNLEGVWSSTANPTVENSFCAGSASATGQGFNTTILHTLALAVAWASTTGAPTITCIGSTFERIGP